MDKKDIFYKDVEGRLDDLKRHQVEKEKLTSGEKVNNFFSILLGLAILFGLLFTLFRVLG